MSRPLRFVLPLALLPLLACGDATLITTPSEPQEVSGVWSGSIAARLGGTGFGFGAGPLFDRMELALTEDADGRVTGAGAFIQRPTGATTGLARTAAEALEVAGTNAFPTVALTLRRGSAFHTAELVYFRARFIGADRLEGELFGAGFNEERVRLRRDFTHTLSFH